MECYNKQGWMLWGNERKEIYNKEIMITYKDSYKKRTGTAGRFGIILAYISAEDVYYREIGETKLHRTKRTTIEKITEVNAW